MKDASKEKMESLMKYVPFIEFVLEIDREKYIKFINIRKWILLKKKNYPLSDLNKIEQSIITQYKNLLLEKKVQIPQNIANIFAPFVSKQFINLCSDDEEDGNQNEKENSIGNTSEPRKEESRRHSNTFRKYSEPKIDNDSEDDDDLEIVSIDHIGNTRQEVKEELLNKADTTKAVDEEEEVVIDKAYEEILCKTDEIAADEIKMKSFVPEPNNYTYTKENESLYSIEKEESIYRRRTPVSDILFKRRADFQDEVVVENVLNSSEFPSAKTSVEVISLDSGSDNEEINDDERPSTSKAATPNIIDIENEKLVESRDSNSNGSGGINKTDKSADLLCNSIDSVLLDAMCDILNEFDVNNESTTNSCDQQISNVGTGKQNVTKSKGENNTNILNNCKLTSEQICKIVRDISQRADIESEIFQEAFMHVFQLNAGRQALSETPPPAPSPIANNLLTPPVQPCNIPQQPAPFVTLMTPHYAQNFVPMAGTAPPRPKININDPRIKKQIQIIQNSPLFKYNVLNTATEQSIRKICQSQCQQQTQSQQQTSFTLSGNSKNNNMAPLAKIPTGTHKSPISYGEYKRRQVEKKLEMERQRQEERMAKEMEQKRAMLELSKSKEDIRSKLLSTLNPCKEQLATLWSQQKNSTINSSCGNECSDMVQKQQKDNSTDVVLPSIEEMNASESNNGKKVKECRILKKDGKQSENENEDNNCIQNNNKNSEHKLNRMFKELRCTVKGFDQMRDYISESDYSYLPSDTLTMETIVAPKPIGLRRRSSIHALSAITEQLSQQLSDCSDSESNYTNSSKRRKSSSDNLPQDSLGNIRKRRKTIDEIIRPSSRAKALRIVESSSEDETTNTITKQAFVRKEAVVKLCRISKEFISKHTKKPEKDSSAKTPLARPDVESFRLKKTCERVENLKEPARKVPKLKKYNNDCQMTERNTAFCVLCRSKPLDLTNHYIGRHKTESYVSRLDWSELEDLAINIPFAILQPKSKNYRFERYEVQCPFCKEYLLDQFINLYNHYSAHTGEYAFQCSHCHLSKPYRPDIQSHILHSKTCRNSSIQVMYRYPPQAQCIYLHYCTICNFVQLNEANVLKHLREHHDHSKAITSNIQKCILAAISDGPDMNQAFKSPSPTLSAPSESETLKKDNTTPECTAAISGEASPMRGNISVTEIQFKVDDDDIPVSNEPCVDDEYLAGKFLLEEQLRKTHEGQSKPNTLIPMTILHSIGNDNPATNIPNLNTIAPQRHLPIQIKAEVENNATIPHVGSLDYKPAETPAITNQPVLRKDALYERYRSYPPNVSYLGLYKCMIDDCFYSTDSSEEILNHLTEHTTDGLKSNEYLQCPYCIIIMDIPITPIQLVEHIRTQHGHLNFQCSMCCYRSSTASNVHIHQQTQHNSVHSTCKIYKCSGDVLKVEQDYKPVLDLDNQIAKNISKISCKFCNAGFYYTKFLMHHLNNEHKMHNIQDIQIYSCIYCPYMAENKDQIRTHVATKHPGELPLIYDHNIQIGYDNEDTRSSSNVVDVSESVAWSETTPTVCFKENLTHDVKPDLNELLRMNEEIIKVRLLKLTAHTGVPPDSLYRCPEPICGGFFSNFELWFRHMKMRHHTLECKCPHCSTEELLPLEQFALHVEQHRRHTFICFYCSTTNPTEILARQHATEMHSEFGTMRLEQIRVNLSYSFNIVIKSDLFQEREKFIAEFLLILDNHLKKLESIRLQKLKKQWPVQANTPWIDDYLEMFSKRRVGLRCLVKDCDFRTCKEEKLYRHLSTSHTINGTQFNCSKCDYQVQQCNNLDELFDHIKLHNEYIFICTACSSITPSRSKMSYHIAEQHSARDVPVIHLFRTGEQMFIKIYIVFSDCHLSFSTMKNCFCCSEQNMNGDVYNLHLKNYHKLSLNYYCEKCTNFSFKSLKEVKPHFEQFHNSNKIKISCELAGHNDLYLTSLNDFQIQISQPDAIVQHIKSESLDPFDTDVVLIEDNDIEIEKSIRDEQLKQPEIPQLKCMSLSKLMAPRTNTLPLSYLSTQLPLFQPDFLPINQFTSASSLPSPIISSATAHDDYNLNTINADTNSSINISNPLHSIAAPSATTNITHILHNGKIISSTTNIPTRIGSLPMHIQGQINRNMHTPHLPNNIYVAATTPAQNPVPFSITAQKPSTMSIQNPTYN